MGIIPKIEKIPLKHIDVSKLNVRQTNAKERIDELAESIKEQGLLQPGRILSPVQ